MRLVSFYTKYNHSDPLETAEIQGCNGTLHHERIPESKLTFQLVPKVFHDDFNENQSAERTMEVSNWSFCDNCRVI